MLLMIIAILIIAGLCLGSFVNALVWRLHSQAAENNKKKPDQHYLSQLSIAKGRSICPHCKHQLTTIDLIPVISWLMLKGECRYCKKSISAQYPIIELATAFLFIASYVWWPTVLSGAQISIFVFWLMLVVGFMSLIVYDLRWLLLPDRIVYPLGVIALVLSTTEVFTATRPLIAFLNLILAVVVGGGIFYVLFQVSEGKWIGGGDVKLGWLLGLIAGTPARSLLLIFLAAVFGSLFSVPLLATKRLKRTSTIPFGPFLIVAMIVVELFGASILLWYQKTVLKL